MCTWGKIVAASSNRAGVIQLQFLERRGRGPPLEKDPAYVAGFLFVEWVLLADSGPLTIESMAGHALWTSSPTHERTLWQCYHFLKTHVLSDLMIEDE